MNQILVTEKLYITPELKRKKKIYKFYFFLSIFLVCILISAYIYAEYDRNKSEEVSQEILSNVEVAEDNTVIPDDALIILLDDDVNQIEENNEEQEQQIATQNSSQQTRKATVNGETYEQVATINIPKINVNYPILQGDLEQIDTLLKISPCKFWGGEPNEVGNFCIVGHNYRNTKFFSKVPTLAVGDTIDLTDISGRTITYAVYDKYTVDPTDVSCTSQLTNGKKEVTLITCTDDSKQRVIVKTREVK